MKDNGVVKRLWRRKSIPWVSWGFAGCGLLLAGCASESTNERRMEHYESIANLHPPTFLTGPMSVLLTNVAGFSAHLKVERGPTETLDAPSGELLGREGKLVFAPKPGDEAKTKGAPSMFFTWNVADGSGFAMSEALQGYAPITASFRVSEIVESTSTVSESVGGHACTIMDETLRLLDGTTAKYKVWRAADLHGFPMRIQAAGSGAPLTVNFSEVRLESSAKELFQPPDGFTKYSSIDVMMNELMIRQMDLRRGGRRRGGDDTSPPGDYEHLRRANPY